MNVLIVEDEKEIAAFVRKGLVENGYEVTVSYDAPNALRAVSNIEFNLILLDIMIPGMDGIQLCQLLRKDLKFKGAIIMLTALGTTDDVVEGLNAGADDYLQKPFKFKELLARINAQLRRRENAGHGDRITVNDLVLDDGLKKVWRADIEIPLTAKEYNLLKYLLLNKNRVVSRVDILENVWEVNFDLGTNVIDVYMNYLRNKIDKPFEEKLIHTVVGMGYILKG